MPGVPRSTRWILAIGLVVSAMVCCCQGRSAVRLLAGFGEDSAAIAAEHGCCGSSETQPDHNPTNDRHDQRCQCRSHDSVKDLSHPQSMVENTGSIPPLTATPLLFSPAAAQTPRAKRDDSHLVVRPPDSLLRLHCALTI